MENSSYLPVGLAFNPYIEYDNGFGVGAGIGPVMYIGGDVELFAVPIRVDLRYAFMPESNVSPYIRGGASYILASGDYVESSKLGAFGALGMEFLRTRAVGFGAEVAHDSSTIEFEDVENDDTTDRQPIKLMISLFAVF